MNNKMNQVFLGFLITVLFIFVDTIFASTWFLRPTDGEYGTGDGTSYENAWNQMTYQEWLLYIEPGDTLYVCGLYVSNWIFIKKSGTPDNPITIRGDYYQEHGTVLAASSVYDSLWVKSDSLNNIWSQKWQLDEPFPTYLCFEKNDTSGVDGIVPLKRVNTNNFDLWESGSYFYDDLDSSIYYKPSGVNANDFCFLYQWICSNSGSRPT